MMKDEPPIQKFLKLYSTIFGESETKQGKEGGK